MCVCMCGSAVILINYTDLLTLFFWKHPSIIFITSLAFSLCVSNKIGGAGNTYILIYCKLCVLLGKNNEFQSRFMLFIYVGEKSSFYINCYYYYKYSSYYATKANKPEIENSVQEVNIFNIKILFLK